MERFGLAPTAASAANELPLDDSRATLAAAEPEREVKDEPLACVPILRVRSTAEADTRRRKAQSQRDAELLAAFAVARMMGRRKQADETFMEFATALLEEGDGHAIAEPFFVAAFVNGLDDDDTARLLRTTKPSDLRSATKEAIWLRRSDGAAVASERHEKRTRPAESGAARPDRHDIYRSDSQKEWKRARRDAEPLQARKLNLRCFFCGEHGHYARECPVRWGRVNGYAVTPNAK